MAFTYHKTPSLRFAGMGGGVYGLAMQIQWSWKPFAQLSLEELYAIIQLRIEVFSVEQNCPYQDLDYLDQQAFHLMGMLHGKLQVYARILPPTGRYPKDHSIGRVVSASTSRGKGLGKAVMEEAIRRIEGEMGKVPIRISAQAYLQRFYESFGFVKVTEPYLEDNIPHIEMLRATQN